ncbi:MAG: hypothetical protein M3N33_00385 [Actinomycetota bacterium]|nr:hypothetical protein [Actinomycetota bacterium]
MDGRCGATKRDGTGCTLPATGQHGLCWAHDPKNAEKRRRGASRGGRAKAGTEIRDLKKQLEDLAGDVLAGRVERPDAAVVNQILNTRAWLIELERKVKETEELEERLSVLERAREGGGRRWG